MTAFTTSNIPTNINTVEKLASWVGLLLARLNPTLSVLEQQNAQGERVCQASIFRASDGTIRLVVRLSMPLNDDYDTATTKVWESTQAISNTAIPAAYTSN